MFCAAAAGESSAAYRGARRYSGRRLRARRRPRLRENNNHSRNKTHSNMSQERRCWLGSSFTVALSALATGLKHLNESALARPINTQTLNNASGAAATLLVSPSVL